MRSSCSSAEYSRSISRIHQLFAFSFFSRMASSVGITRFHLKSLVGSVLLIAQPSRRDKDVSVRFAGAILRHQRVVCLRFSLATEFPLQRRDVFLCLSGGLARLPSVSRARPSSGWRCVIMSRISSALLLAWVTEVLENICQQRPVRFHVRFRGSRPAFLAFHWEEAYKYNPNFKTSKFLSR